MVFEISHMFGDVAVLVMDGRSLRAVPLPEAWALSFLFWFGVQPIVLSLHKSLSQQ